jgi:hypothetical protein
MVSLSTARMNMFGDTGCTFAAAENFSVFQPQKKVTKNRYSCNENLYGVALKFIDYETGKKIRETQYT